MKRFYVLLIGLFCGVLLGVLWVILNPQGEPEAIKIYKYTPYTPEPVDASEVGIHSVSTRDATVTKAVYSDKYETDNTDVLEESRETEKAEQDSEIGEENKSFEFTDDEIADFVLVAYRLEDILSEYGVTFTRRNGNGICPFCAGHDQLKVYINGKTGDFGYWGCKSPYCFDNGVVRPNDLVDFVRKMEGLERPEAARYLFERAGLHE